MQFLTQARYYLPLQHHDVSYDPHRRILMHGARPVEENSLTEIDSLSAGPISGWLLLESKDQETYPRQWAQIAPVSLTDGKWSPRAASWDTPQTGLADLARPQTPLGLELPGDYPGVAVAGVEMDGQVELVAPAWAGLVAPSLGGSIDLASVAWDCDDKDLNRDRRAPIISSWRIYDRPELGVFGAADVLKHKAIAWQLGLGAGGDDPLQSVAGLGMCIEEGLGRSVLAAGVAFLGGPFDVGDEADRHHFEVDPTEKTPINSLHLSSRMLIRRPGGSADGSQEDGGAYRLCQAGPHNIQAHWRWDSEAFHDWALGTRAGQWRWQASTWIALPPDDSKPPPERLVPQPPLIPSPKGEPEPPPRLINPEDFAPKKLGPEKKQDLPLASTAGEVGVRGLVFRESADWRAFRSEVALDLRNETRELTEEQRAEWIAAPAVLRAEAVAHGLTRAEEKTSRYRNVAPGALWLLPAEQGMEDVLWAANAGFSPRIDPYTLGERQLAMARGVALTWGSPAADAPWLTANGWKLGQSSSTTTLRLWSLSSAGAATERLQVTTSGFAFLLPISSSSSGTFGTSVSAPTHIVTGSGKTLSLVQGDGASWATDRTQYFQDRDGIVALTAMRYSTHTANFTAVEGTVHGVKSTGGAYTATLPEIDTTDDTNIGELIVIADIDGGALANNIAINVAGSSGDLILGASSIAIEDAYGCIKLRAAKDGTQGIWIREC